MGQEGHVRRRRDDINHKGADGNCGVCAVRQEGGGRIGGLDKWPKFQCRSGLERDHMFLTATGQLIDKTDEADT